MDNKAVGFAQKIISELQDIKRLLHDGVLGPSEVTASATHDKRKAQSAKDNAIDHLPTVPRSETIPPQPKNTRSKDKNAKSWKWLKKHGVEILGVVIVASYTVITRCTLNTMVRSNGLAQANLNLSQRANVTIGRKDGVIADFVIPKDPKQNAEIVIYFQNSGRLAAQFAWGTSVPFLAAGGKKKLTGISYTHPFKGLAIRKRDRKTGAENSEGDIGNIIAGDSIFVSTLGEISQKDLADLPANNMGALIIGMYEYCDELGNYSSYSFGLRYRSSAATSSLSFDLAMETPVMISHLPEPTATTEYFRACETAAERERYENKTEVKR